MTNNENDIFSAAGRADDELTPFDVRDSSGRAGIVKLAIGFGFLLALALIILKVYQPGVRDRDAPPKIIADNTPFKVEPENAGGVDTPNQDKTVYEVMDGNTPNEAVTTKPGAETPIELPKSANIRVEPAPSRSTAAKPRPAAPKPKPQAANPSGSVKAAGPGYVKSAPNGASIRTGNSDFVVQVASVRTSAAAQEIWTKTETKFSDVINSQMYADIKFADLAEKGIYYRLRVAGLADKTSAIALCDKFKARGQACFVTRK
ncbi:SPOR domain-containing protein [Hellea balneolensis]|uniref:SPOR domain-containing protein n=1 Tax=Hellea balneolensis TaxID=287478 RepID=UPI0003F5C5C2|nr:SPOR domain-containing protein [Hellea balneolensis]